MNDKNNQSLEYVIVLAIEKRNEKGQFPDVEMDKKEPDKQIYAGGRSADASSFESGRALPECHICHGWWFGPRR
jgi:hypothetical protein